jgi:bifunctional ADP-heptose synthase (sugar kinase/adenylyltransferase)
LDTRTKILTPEQALELGERLRNQGRRVAALAGTFDVLLAETAGRIAGAVAGYDVAIAVVGDGADELLPRSARAELAAGLRAIDWVVALDNDAHKAFLDRLAPDAIVSETGSHTAATAGLIAHVQRRQSN